jgi:hypothetical protein
LHVPFDGLHAVPFWDVGLRGHLSVYVSNPVVCRCGGHESKTNQGPCSCKKWEKNR